MWLAGPHLSLISSVNLIRSESHRVEVCPPALLHWLAYCASPRRSQGLTSYFLGELDALGVRQGFGLLVDVLYIQHLTHELYHRLSSVESGR